MAHRCGFRPEDLGRTFRYADTRNKIVGLKPNVDRSILAENLDNPSAFGSRIHSPPIARKSASGRLWTRVCSL
jgi:hypothetical protein